MASPVSGESPVLVVGAGPAGATAARRLALAGVKVRLLDRAVFPRNKPCGGAISLRVLRRFPYLERELARIATHEVSRLYLEGPDGASAIVESPWPAVLMIRRVEFDALLVSLAVEAGAELVTGADIVQARETADAVELAARDGRRFSAPVVIAADGVYSVVARRLGLNHGWPDTSVALDMMEETPRTVLRDLDPSTLWVVYGCEPPGARDSVSRNGRAAEGYAYVFPKKDHVNVGIGYVLSHYRTAIDQTPYDLQRGFVDLLRRRGVTEGESVRANFTPFQIPVGGPLRRPGRGRTLLAGDAGGFVNGVTAEGIYYAMVSGDLAARAVCGSKGLSNGATRTLATRYARACNREMGAELRDSVLIQQYLFADRRRIAKLVEGARRQGALARLALEFAVGRAGYRALRRRLLLGSPRLGAQFLAALVKRHRSRSRDALSNSRS
jgi:geranylgeranyl reductase family protein